MDLMTHYKSPNIQVCNSFTPQWSPLGQDSLSLKRWKPHSKRLAQKGNVLVQGLKHSGLAGSGSSTVPLHLLTLIASLLAPFSDSPHKVAEAEMVASSCGLTLYCLSFHSRKRVALPQ